MPGAPISRTIDKKRTALVQPHLDAQRDINSKWMPLEDLAKSAAKMIKAAQDVWANVGDRAVKIAKPTVEIRDKVRVNLEKFVWSSREK